MGRYQLTRAADEDVDEIWNYVAEASGPKAADRLEVALHHAMKRLARAPGIGHLRSDLAAEPLRFHPVKGILIVYLPNTRPLRVLRVLSGARDIGAILEAGTD